MGPWQQIRFDRTRRDVLKGLAAGGLAVAGSPRNIDAFGKAEITKVGVIYVSPITEIGWTKQHELARRAAEEELGPSVKFTTVESVSLPQDVERVCRELIAQGHKLIFATSFSHGTAIRKVALTAPDTFFEHCSGLEVLRNVGVFQARYYEGTFLSGVAAGRMSKTGILGFIGGFPVPDVIAAFNSLVLGARRVNRDAKAKVIWLNSWFDPEREREAAIALITQGADVIISTQDSPSALMAAEEQNAYTIGYAGDYARYAPKRCLTSFTLDWTSIYLQSIRAVMNDRWRATTRWEGLKARVVKMSRFNPIVPESTITLVREISAAIMENRLHPFHGPIRDQLGRLRVTAGSVITDEQLRTMNWAVEGVEGVLPE